MLSLLATEIATVMVAVMVAAIVTVEVVTLAATLADEAEVPEGSEATEEPTVVVVAENDAEIPPADEPLIG